MTQRQTCDKLIESHGITAVFINEKRHCLRITESRNPTLYQIGFVIIGVNGNCFTTDQQRKEQNFEQVSTNSCRTCEAV